MEGGCSQPRGLRRVHRPQNQHHGIGETGRNVTAESGHSARSVVWLAIVLIWSFNPGATVREPMPVFRYVISPLAGITIAVALLYLTSDLLPIGDLSLAGIGSGYLVALVGGVAVAAVAPRFGVVIAAGTGLIAPGLIYWSVLVSRSRAYWEPFTLEAAWTIGVPIAFAIGAFGLRWLRSRRRQPSTAYERT
jgi:hypothetical protein